MEKSTSFDHTTHLKEEHNISPLQTYLKEIVYGGNDGIVTTFAVVAGFTGANLGNAGSFSFLTVLLFGMANLFADGVSMGLGNFLSLRSEKDVYKAEEAKERYEVRNNPASEITETIEILRTKGFTQKQAEDLTRIYSTNEEYWINFMMQHELELPNPSKENPVFTALATFFAFVVFGSIPLLPYLFLSDSSKSFQYATTAAGSALLLLGLLRWRISKESLIRSVSEILLVGGLAASVAYLVGTFFTL